MPGMGIRVTALFILASGFSYNDYGQGKGQE